MTVVRKIFADSLYYVKGCYVRFRDGHVGFYAAGIAFNGLLCLIPFLLLLTSILGAILASSDLAIKQITDVLNAAFPPDRYAQQIKHSLEQILDDIVRHKTSYGGLGIIILLWRATSLFGSIRTALNTFYKITTRKLLVITIFEEALLVIILGTLFVAANVFIWISSIIQSFISKVPVLSMIPEQWFAGANALIVSYIPGFIMFYLVSRFIPDNRVTSRVAMIAALITTGLWWIAGRLFIWYLSAFHSFSTLYGTYAFLLVFLFWVYYSSIAFIAGVVVAQLYRERRA